MPATTVTNHEFDRALAKCIQTFLDDHSDHQHYMDNLSVACRSEEQWNIVCDTLLMVSDPDFIIGELPADFPMAQFDPQSMRYFVSIDAAINDYFAFQATKAQQQTVQQVVTGKMPDDELIERILWLLGVDPADWSNSLSGIYAAIRSNQQIGEPNMSKIEDWTDGKINDGSLTQTMFKLLERAQQTEKGKSAALHIATKWALLHQALSDVLGLEFLPDEDITRYIDAIKILRARTAWLDYIGA